MSQHIEWGTGLGDWTVNPGEWVDGYGSRNEGVALWSGDGDGIIVEMGSIANAVKALRALADEIEKAHVTSRRDLCRYCRREIVFVPESMAENPSVWVHVHELGAQVPEQCGDTDRDITPEHRFVDDEAYCRDCLTHRSDADLPCIPTEEED